VVSSASGVPARIPRYQRLVDGLVLPAEVAGDTLLDFCNTRAGWGAAAPREYLTSYDHLVVWTREAGLVRGDVARRLQQKAAKRPTEADHVLGRALALRSAVYAACTAPAAGGAWEAVADEARAAASLAVLDHDAPPGERWLIPERVGLALPALELALGAGAFLAATDLATVSRCPGHDCGWLFLDPRGRRRWCVMAVCGNREKARRHAQKGRA
jgi:predicted RNA-binding Zn ribbon-like protein